MKKLFLFVTLSALAFSFNSCSDDDSSNGNNNNNNGTGGTMTFMVNGVSKTFDTVTVDVDTETVDGVVEEFLTVTASPEGSATEFITFSLEKGDVGADAAYSFMYEVGGNTYDGYEMNINVAENNDDKIRGTFAGDVSYWSNEDQAYVTRTITEGAFNINR